MKILPFLPVGALASVVTFGSLTSALHAATTIGNSAVNRDNTDSFSGQIFVLNANLSSLTGQRVQSWQFFNNSTSSAVTPVLVEDLGANSFAVRGIGTTIISNLSGVQGGSFNLVSGTDVIGTNYYLGYYDGSWNGSAATPGPGGVEFNFTNDPPVGGEIDSLGTFWLHAIPNASNNPANMGVGALNSRDLSFPAGVDDRHYSVNFSVVPEPSAALLGTLAGLLTLRRRR